MKTWIKNLARSDRRARRAAAAACAAVLAMAAGGVPARASTVVPHSPEQVLAAADSVFRGTVVEAKVRWASERRRMIVTDYTVTLDEVVDDQSGAIAKRSRAGVVTLTFAGGELVDDDGRRHGVEVHGVPRLVVGDQAFFFLDSRSEGSFSPLVGMSYGLDRIVRRAGAGGNAASVVMEGAACCAAGTPATRRYFSDKPEFSAGMTPEQFSAEIRRALPIARADASLRMAGPAIDAGGPEATPRCEIARSSGGAGGGGEALAPVLSPRGTDAAAPAARFMLAPGAGDSATTVVRSPMRDRWGTDRPEPDSPFSFNVPPVLGAFRSQFLDAEATWNLYADHFRYNSNSDNVVGWHNGRNDMGIMTNQQMIDVYERAWGPNDLAVCMSRWTDEIIEADILFHAGRMWTTDYATAYARCNDSDPGNQTYYLYTVALHELGHSFGRAHAWVTDAAATYPSIMNYFTDSVHADAGVLTADDANSIRSIYWYRQVNTPDLGVYLWANTGTIVNGVNGLNWSVATPAQVNAGATFQLQNFTVENIGSGSQLFTVVDFYLCPARGSFAGAVYCGSLQLSGMAPGSSQRLTQTITAPSSTPFGDYFVAARINDGSDGNQANNSSWLNQTVRVIPLPPGNNTCQNATPIDGPGAYPVNLAGASNDGSASVGRTGTPDVWFKINLPGPARWSVQLDSCGLPLPYDTVLSIHHAAGGMPCPGTIANQAGADDDGCGVNRGSRLSFTPEPGETYLVRVAQFDTAPIPAFDLNVTMTPLAPANDDCFSAWQLPEWGSLAMFTSSLAAATPDGSSACSSANTPDAWWWFQNPYVSGTLRVFTCGTNDRWGVDTVLSLHAFLCGEIPGACNDDAVGGACGGADQAPLRDSYLSWHLNANQRVKIRVGTYNGTAGGTYQLGVGFIPDTAGNDRCTSPITLPENTAVAAHNFTSAGNDAGGCIFDYSDVWFRYVAPCTGTASVTIPGNYNFTLIAYDSATCPPGGFLSCNWAAELPFHALPDRITFPCAAGRTYTIRVATAAGLGGPFTIQASCAASPTGACCNRGRCTTVIDSACAAAGGSFLGSSVACSSNAANPTTCCDANIDGQGGVSVNDIFVYLAAWFGGNLAADFNHDGQVSLDDLFRFLEVYFAGC